MKSFVYGIDGGDREIFEYFQQQMPFYQKLTQSHIHLNLHEDLLHRGWSEIITGATGEETGGFYMSPDLDGSANFSMKYKMAEVPDKAGIQLLWDALPSGIKVGAMNIPSLMPVSKVNGFCVGSAGAGISKVDEITSDLAFPDTVKDFLNKEKYIPDIRIGPSGIKDMDELFRRLKEMESKRVNCYIKLAQEHEVDFGLLIDRATTVVQYLFRSEIQALMDRDDGKQPLFPPTRKVEKLLKDFYAFVDENIKLLFEEFHAKQFLVVSDHGHAPMTHHCNINAILFDSGFYFPSSGGYRSNEFKIKLLIKKIKRFIKRAIPASVLANILNSFLGKAKKIVSVNIKDEFDKEKTLAFSNWYMPGIYINDSRFFGAVKEEERKSLVKNICDVINEHPDSVTHGVTAEPYREYFSGSKYNEKLPDIRLKMPDYIFAAKDVSSYIEKNPKYGPVPNLFVVDSDMHSGTKSSAALCLVDGETAAMIKEEDALNLTIVNKLVRRFFDMENK